MGCHAWPCLRGGEDESDLSIGIVSLHSGGLLYSTYIHAKRSVSVSLTSGERMNLWASLMVDGGLFPSLGSVYGVPYREFMRERVRRQTECRSFFLIEDLSPSFFRVGHDIESAFGVSLT